MDRITFALANIYQWAKRDYQSWPFRFCAEIVAWAIGISCALVMALTVPNPPLLTLYPFWITGCSIYAWASWTRGSFGMLLNYLLMVTIDTVALVRLIS